MARQIILLSGQVCTGKTTLADTLVDRFGTSVLKTKNVITAESRGSADSRRKLQDYGEKLDRDTAGKWVANFLLQFSEKIDSEAIVVVDSIRITEQAEEIRRVVKGQVFHVHLEAPHEVLAARYEHKRRDFPSIELSSYSDLSLNKTEGRIQNLRATADVVIDTALCREEDVVARAAGHLGLYGREYQRLVDVVVGAQYGSEGKGHICSYLAPDYDVLVRVGGPNAGHTVYEEPTSYVHHQLPSGTRRSQAKLLIGPGAVIDCEKLLEEIKQCGVTPERLSIDPQAMTIEQTDKETEVELVAQIGSTGQGVGAAGARRISGRGSGTTRLARDVSSIRPFLKETLEELERAYYSRKKIMLEGTQGSGLSLFHGSYPHVTSRDTTVGGTLAEAGISPRMVRRIILVCRPYPIRVQNGSDGTSGPLNQEITWEEVSRRSGVPIEQLQSTEKTSTTRKKRRVGEFDWSLLRRSASLNGPTDIALTFSDYINVANEEAYRFEQLTQETIRFVEEIEKIAAAPVSLISTGFGRRTIIDRRAW